MVAVGFPVFDVFMDKLKRSPIFGECITIEKTHLKDFFTYRDYGADLGYTPKIGKMRTVRGFSDEHVISQISEQIFMDLIDSARSIIDIGFAPVVQRWDGSENEVLDDLAEAKRLVRKESQQHIELLVVSPVTGIRMIDILHEDDIHHLGGIRMHPDDNFKSDNHIIAIAPSAGLLLVNEEPNFDSGLRSYHIGFVIIRPQCLLIIQNMFE